MIIFDASYLVVFLNKSPEPPADRQGNPVSQFKERVEYLAVSLNASGEQIGIPTPAMAEVLVRAGKNRSEFVAILNDRMRFQIIVVVFDHLVQGAKDYAQEASVKIKTRMEAKFRSGTSWLGVELRSCDTSSDEDFSLFNAMTFRSYPLE